MAALKDPTREALIKELRDFRKIEGEPAPHRLDGLFYLTEILGEGASGRAFDGLMRLREQHGADPRSTVGTYFYLCGYGIGLDSVNQRRVAYEAMYGGDPSTIWRRADRGIQQLATMIRDDDEISRPWALISIFQSGNAFQPFLDFNLGYESWKPPTVLVSGEEVPIEFTVRNNTKAPNRFAKRVILPESPLDVSVEFGQPMATVRVLWPMPVWPVWNVVSWTADPRILTRLRTFRQRAVEISLEWWRKTPAAEVDGLVVDNAIWSERRDVNAIHLPSGWSITPGTTDDV